MSEKEQEKQKVRVYDIVSTYPDADGNTQTEFHEYGLQGGDIPGAIVDYGDYWDLGDGSLELVADDTTCISYVEDISDGWGRFSVKRFSDYCNGLKPGEWAEWKDGEYTIRVTALADIPKISVEKTIVQSDLSPMQMNRIRIYGKQLFGDGDVSGTSCLRPNLANEINAMWTEYVNARCIDEVYVSVDEKDLSADYLSKHVTIKAPSVEALHSALKILGVMEPEKIKIDYTVGEGEAVKQVTAVFWLSSVVE